MIKELERLLSNSYAPLTKKPSSALVLMKDKKVYGGVKIENNIYKKFINAEESAIANAVSHGYTKKDFEALYILIYDDSFTNLNYLSKNMILEFFDSNKEIYIYDKQRNLKTIKVRELINNIY